MVVTIDQEKRVVERMIRLYCRKYERNQSLCSACKALLDYAHQRLSRCRYDDAKPTCRMCSIHCYRPDMRKKMQKVMRYAGPRMLIYHPKDALMHLWNEMKFNRGRDRFQRNFNNENYLK
ncbi:MAG: nitrous oxide-stimulated promoter family protein [Bacteroidaceae bacterium]|nr:nitrous oxide-stimulated promoter family protein [Bacteroidaceae bacterium]